MISSKSDCNKNIQYTRLTLPNGWSGRAVLSGGFDRCFTRDDWIECLSRPEELFEDVEETLKVEGPNRVAVKKIKVGNNEFKAVVKRRCCEGGLRGLLRSLRAGKAVREFRTSLKLLSCGIAVAAPLAALYQRRNLLSKQSIYINEYLENSPNLCTFLSEELPKAPGAVFAVKKRLSSQLATILAMLHRNGLWHRDAKASNFIVRGGREQRFRSLWQLAASVMSLPAIYQTDYLRTFVAYSNLTGLEVSQRRGVFRELVKLAQVKRMRLIARANNRLHDGRI